MSVRRVLRMGDPQLLRISEPVQEFDSPRLRELLANMRDTMAALSGAGLAAPQIGVPWRVVILGTGAPNPRYPEAEVVPATVLINPELEPLDGEQEQDWEGCLSVPGMRGLYSHVSNQMRQELRDKLQVRWEESSDSNTAPRVA